MLSVADLLLTWLLWYLFIWYIFLFIYLNIK